MKRFRILSIVMIVVILLGSMGISSAAADPIEEKRQELAELQKEWDELESSIKDLGKDLESQQLEVSKFYKQIDNLEKQIEAYESQIKLVDQDIADKTTRITALGDEIVAKEKEMVEILEQLKKRVKAISKTGNYSSLQLLMSMEDYTDYLLKSQVIKCVSDHDRALREAAEAEKKAIAEKKQEAEAEKAAVEASRAELLKLKADLDGQVSTLEPLYTKAKNAKVALEKQLGTYEKEQEKIKKAEEELEKDILQLMKGEATATYGGKMFWPVPVAKTISSPFGQRSSGFHGGVDIWCSGILKKPIYAAADGEVVKSTWHYSYGYYVMVDHGLDKNGVRIMTLYAHMYQTPSVKVGDMVVGGKTQLGLVGNTGNSFGAHLHFEVRENGTRVDPIGKGYVVKPS